MEKTPKVTGYPLSLARSRLEEAGFYVKLKKTLPPGGQPPGDNWRVLRQSKSGNQEIELLISLQSW